MVRIQPRHRLETGINLTPLVDVVFQLMIFFLLTWYFVEPAGLAVKLPTAEGSELSAQKELVVVVEKNGRVIFAGATLAPAQLTQKISEALAQNPEAAVVIQADREAILQHAVTVMEACKKAGAQKLILATERPAPP